MRNMSKEKRALRIQAMGRHINQRLSPRSSIRCLTELSKMSGLNQGASTADWLRDGRRIELKSSGLVWDRGQKRWLSLFCGIKPDLFDELWLAIRSPLGIHFYKAESLETLDLGVGTGHGAWRKVFYGPNGEADGLKAFQVIEAKMIAKGCQLVAVVEWDRTASGK